MQFSAHRIGLDVLQSRSWRYFEGYAASDNGAIADTQSAATSGGRRDFDHRQKSPWKSSVLDWIQSDFWWSGSVTVMDSSNCDALSRRKVRGKPAKRCTTDICALRYVEHYHRERNHQGVGHVLIEPGPEVKILEGGIRRRKRLGGLLNYYYREAA